MTSELPGLPEVPAAWMPEGEGGGIYTTVVTDAVCAQALTRDYGHKFTPLFTADQMLALRAASVAYGRGEVEALVVNDEGLIPHLLRLFKWAKGEGKKHVVVHVTDERIAELEAALPPPPKEPL